MTHSPRSLAIDATVIRIDSRSFNELRRYHFGACRYLWPRRSLAVRCSSGRGVSDLSVGLRTSRKVALGCLRETLATSDDARLPRLGARRQAGTRADYWRLTLSVGAPHWCFAGAGPLPDLKSENFRGFGSFKRALKPLGSSMTLACGERGPGRSEQWAPTIRACPM